MRLRAFILLDEPLCRICVASGIARAADEIDHIKPLSQGGTNQRDNLQPLCYQCHAAKTEHETHGYVKGCDAEGNPADPSPYWR